MLIESKEDGEDRERKFRWRNNQEGFSMDDENARDIDLIGGEDATDESEANWRKMRHERELMIMEQNKNAENTQEEREILLLDQNSQTVSTSNSMFLTKKRITVFKTSTTMDQGVKKDSPFLISTYKNASRSSFLSRDENTLSKIANFTKSTTEADSPNTFVTNRGNFVFASLSPVVNKSAEAAGRNKRKSEPTKITNDNKKQKIYVHSKKKLIIDQLNN